MHLLLASSSPRRAALLRAAGLAFDVVPVHLDERTRPGESVEEYVTRLAIAKASTVAAKHPDAFVIGADTTVVIRGQVLGKPVNTADAERMIRMLMGRTHEVFTGVCVQRGSRQLVHVEPSRVQMAQMTEAEISWYVRSGEPMDKAGGYAIQGLASRFIDEVHGSYTNVVGLPVTAVYNLLKQLGCDILTT